MASIIHYSTCATYVAIPARMCRWPAYRMVPHIALLFIDNSHFVVLYNVREKKNGEARFYIADPARGHVTYNREEFEDKWIKKNENKTRDKASYR